MILIAKVGAPYSLQGKLKLHLLSSSIEKALSYGDWYIQEYRSNIWKVLEEQRIIQLGNKLFIQLNGICTKESASCFTNSLIGVPRDALPSLGNDEFYWDDLIGLDVFNENGDFFGKVKHVIETGSHDVLLCELHKREYLIPFVSTYVMKVDFGKNRIITSWHFSYT